MDSSLSLFFNDDILEDTVQWNKNLQSISSSKSCHQLCIPETDQYEAYQISSSLPPENEEGNVEYKRTLVAPTASRLEHLVTQLKWRLAEGQGEAVYELGVEDNGIVSGLPPEELRLSLQTLEEMAKRLGATTSVLRQRPVLTNDSEKRAAIEVLVRRLPEDHQLYEFRMALLGGMDAGKSTLLGVLTQGELDNGRGRARLNLFRHLHEIQTGRTSCISHEIMGFNTVGDVVNYSNNRTAEDIVAESTKILTMLDLAGHAKYQRTTLRGLTAYAPQLAVLVISASADLQFNSGGASASIGCDQAALALGLGVPIAVVVSKMDLCSEEEGEVIVRRVEQWLTGPCTNRIPMRVRNMDEAVTAAKNFLSDKLTPIFCLSSVTGHGITLLTSFLNLVPATDSSGLAITRADQLRLSAEPAEHCIEAVWPDATGKAGTCVLGGAVRRGFIREGDALLLGPLDSGRFELVVVTSLHRNRVACSTVQAGQTAAVAVSAPADILAQCRRGQVLLHPRALHSNSRTSNCCVSTGACLRLLTRVFLVRGRLQKGIHVLIHCGNVCQAAELEMVESTELKHGEKSDSSSNEATEAIQLLFRFLRQPEFIRSGSRLVFRAGRHVVGFGQVVEVFPIRDYDDDAGR